MSKITLPLLMVFAAIGFLVLAKLDRDGAGKRQAKWPTKSSLGADEEGFDPEPEPVRLKDRLTRDEFERDTNREMANLRLLPTADDAFPVSFLWPSDENDRPAHPELLEIAKRDDFDSWKSFSDEHIGFYYPDAPGIRVEVVGATDALPLIGATMLPPDSGTFKKYRISAGETGTLCVISLAHTTEFDDAPRAPQPGVLRRFMTSGGGLLRASFTARGQVRRVEVLGDGVRVSILDWPHLAIQENVYLRIALGLELVQGRANIHALREAAISKYGLEGRIGFLDHGTPESLVVAMLGPPLAQDGTAQTSLDYFRADGHASIFYHVPMADGYFGGFAENWREETRRAPEHGSIRWMIEKTDYHAGPAGGIGYNLNALTDLEAQAMFDRIVGLAPSASHEDWSGLCTVVANLAQHGLTDQRIVDVARVRLEAPSPDHSPAILALEACGSDLAKAAIAEHVIERFANPTIEPDTLEHFYTLFAYLGTTHPATLQLIDRALSHKSEKIRELGFKYCRWLPEKFALPHLEAGLHDASTEIRRRCAGAFASDWGDPGHHPTMLSICLSSENDEATKSLLRQAIVRLGGDERLLNAPPPVGEQAGISREPE